MPPIDVDIDSANLITLGEASRVLPRTPTYKTLRSWAEIGRISHRTGKRVFLDIVQVGGVQYTTRASYYKFISELNNEDYDDN